jgi:aspartate aminotransferase
LNDKIKELTITVNAFSKTYSVTGLRVGYCGAPKELAKIMAQIQSHMTSNPNSVAQKMMLAALDIPIERIKEIVAGFKKKRDYAMQRLQDIGLECIKPEGAFYLFFKVGRDSVKFCEDLLEAEKVACVPGAAFGAEGYIRICYAIGDDKLKSGLDKLENFVKSL